jgi:hypothetical protein
MANTQYEEEREGKEKKKRKANLGQTRLTTIHAPLIEEEDAKMNQIMWQNYSYNYRNQLYASPEGSIAADILVCEARVNKFFVFLCKNQKCY